MRKRSFLGLPSRKGLLPQGRQNLSSVAFRLHFGESLLGFPLLDLFPVGPEKSPLHGHPEERSGPDPAERGKELHWIKQLPRGRSAQAPDLAFPLLPPSAPTALAARQRQGYNVEVTTPAARVGISG